MPKPNKTTRRTHRNPLATLKGLTRESSQIYRKVKKGRIDHEQGRSLVWVLAQMRAMVEAQLLDSIQGKLEQLAANNGQTAVYYQHRAQHVCGRAQSGDRCAVEPAGPERQAADGRADGCLQLRSDGVWPKNWNGGRTCT